MLGTPSGDHRPRFKGSTVDEVLSGRRIRGGCLACGLDWAGTYTTVKNPTASCPRCGDTLAIWPEVPSEN